jgi:DNA end-binding protein Ku
MPRSLWNGTIAFGMVRVPVKLYSATEAKAIRFRERHVTDAAAIEHRRVCAKEDKEVAYAEIAKGFEVSPGSYVVLTKEEIAAADGPAARVVEIEHFVAREEIDPVYFLRTYYLGPGKLGDEAYRLLHAGLKRSRRVGIGRFVFHNKAQLVAVRALDDTLALHTMRFADELVGARELEIPAPQRKPTKPELEVARALVDQLRSSFDPDSYSDTYREAVLQLIERKARGETITLPRAEPATEEGDLLGALKASLDRTSQRPRSRSPRTTKAEKKIPGKKAVTPARSSGSPSRTGGKR